ncbi:hypothetical protein ACFX13_038934 [Malus domestica]
MEAEGEPLGDDIYAFRNLEATFDLRGYPLHSGIRNGSFSREIRGGRGSRRQQQSGGTVTTKTGSGGMISNTSGNRGSVRHTKLSNEDGGSGTVERENYENGETFDTASSPLKMRLNFGTADYD